MSASGPRRVISRSEDETERVGAELASSLGRDAVVLLEGDLGCGKTVLTRGIGRALGVDPREIQSPTYNLIHEHEGTAGRLVHVDLYRLERDEIAGIGLEEMLAGDGIKAVEWADRLIESVGGTFPGAIHIRLRRLSAEQREIVIEALDRKSQESLR
ncbi:MAG: tRNA (adenosine(37)-N6)-threonylcarbamoyltransferase complex ATPase subunit type 1 TsaE [Acidobacteriota bacterium]